jgi:rubrerythrin
MSKAERDSRTELQKRQAERSKRKEDRHHAYPTSSIKHAGSLIQQGYRVEEGQDRRRTALNKAVHEYGYAEVVEKVNALSVMNKNHKENYRRLLDDLDYLKEQFRGE